MTAPRKKKPAAKVKRSEVETIAPGPEEVWIFWDQDGCAHFFSDDRVARRYGASLYRRVKP